MYQAETFPVPLDTAASSLFPSKFHRGGPMFSKFPTPERHSHSHNLFYPANRHHQHSRFERRFTEDMLGKGGRGTGGRGYYSSGLLPPSFISQEEEDAEEGRAVSRRMEGTPFPDINEMTFPSPSKYRYRQGNMSRSNYTPISSGTSGQMMFSQKMFSSHNSSYPRRNHKRRGSFSSLVSYNFPPDFQAATSRGHPLESRRGSLSAPYYDYDDSRYSGYMSL